MQGMEKSLTMSAWDHALSLMKNLLMTLKMSLQFSSSIWVSFKHQTVPLLALVTKKSIRQMKFHQKNSPQSTKLNLNSRTES